ncbi:phosphoribosylformylglycinamidine synthase I [Legionella genomosp. 1]|uniref:phosphoribosylformylglycinamidine synthase I n=1 Tax=Legionella genomosp. 1 TaxID=1093625 RepID=UPI001055937C|nr:phosphoribosylformylglycinamidine synthase I [Legionella genomosp. 1]
MIRIGLIQFPGSNCERETALAIKRAKMEPVEFLWNEPLHKLETLDGYVLIGGFSYEDRSRAGIIAALDPVLNDIKKQSLKGKPVLGICNGAQILVESGMIPGYGEIALTENKRIQEGKILGTGFYNSWVNMRLADNYQANAFTRFLDSKTIIHLPVAHAEGRFIMPESLLQYLQENGLCLFRYCDEQGQIIDNFPINPNGSLHNIAAISNEAGNVMAMMPHPERTENGDAIFHSMREYISEGSKPITNYSKRPVPEIPIQSYQPQTGSKEYLIQLNITDNQALTVQKTLEKMGFPVKVKRFDHWEILSESASQLERVQSSGVLFCERKEQIYKPASYTEQNNSFSCLVRTKEDLIGQQAKQTLDAQHDTDTGLKIRHGVVWQFHSDTLPVSQFVKDILSTNILGNRYAHEYFNYDFPLFGRDTR